MAKETYKTWLPVFPGFYETGFMDENQVDAEINFSVESDADEAELPHDLARYIVDKYDLYPEIRYKEYEDALAQQCCEWVEDQLQQILGDKEIKVEFEKVSSPREYNFKNDSIDCKITVDIDKVMDYIKENSDMFEKYLEENYTSYDGFHSYYSNKIADWLDPTQWKEAHQVGAVLDFVVQGGFHNNHKYAGESMLYYAMDRIPFEFLDDNPMLPDILKSQFIKDLADEYMNEWEKSNEYLCNRYHVESLNYVHKQELNELKKTWLDWVFSGIQSAEQLEELCESDVTFEEYLKRIA